MNRYERLREKMARQTRSKYDRVLPLDEMLLNRWRKAEFLGFGEGSSVYENVYVYGKPRIGKNVWIGPLAILDAIGGLTIGNGCDISCGAMIFTHSTHLRCVSEGKVETVKKPVAIGDYVYVGSGAVILPGTTIGSHCVVGAGAVVAKDVPSFCVAAGVPAEIVGRVILEGEKARIEWVKK